MKLLRWTIPCLLGGMLLSGAANHANADPWNKKTYVTISQSIEVPGAVLEPGKYVFKLVNSDSNRHIVQILNERENHVYSTNLAIPKQRMEPADKTVISFYEMPGGGPEPIRSWFYPGDTIGQEFLYPRKRAMEISQYTWLNVPILAEAHETPNAEPARVDITPAPLVEPAVEPTTQPDNSADRSIAAAEEPVVAPPPTPEPATVEPNPDEPTPSDSAAPAEPSMPTTAGNTATIGLLGLGCLGLAASLRMAGKQSGSRS